MKIFYPSAGTVSVWVGNFDSEDEFDKCTDGPITKALGLNTDLAAICEVVFETRALTVQKLIEGFSGWESFVKQTEISAQSRQIQTANAALVCYNLKCDDAPEYWDKMCFLGSFSGQDIPR